MTELFDQEAAQTSFRRSIYSSGGMEPVPAPATREAWTGTSAELSDADPEPRKYATAAEHTAACIEHRNHEYRMRQVWRNIQGAVYLSECGVSQAGVDEYLAGNKIKDAPPLRRRLWRFDAWTQRHFWNVILVILALLTVAGFGVVAAHAVLDEDSAVGFIVFLLGIGGITAEVIRRG